MVPGGRTRTSLSLSLAPFLLASVLAWATVVIGSRIDWTLYGVATVLLVLSGTLAAGRAGGLWTSRYGGVLASLIFLAAVGLLRGAAGGSNAGVAVLSLVPVVYMALFGESRHQLYVVIVAVTLFYLAPILIVGPPAYPHSQYRAALLTAAVSAIVGLTTRRLVADVRHQAREASSRERMLVEVHEVMRGLYSSARARQDVCEAARSIGQASTALIYEPVPGARAMRSTAMAGLQAAPIEISTLRESAVTEAFHTGRALLICEDVETHVGSTALWKAAGEPQAVLYEPLMRGPEPVGVLVVGWPASVRAEGMRATVVALLAHEAASVIDRADELSELSDMASSDPLTGLPNRRAWDARVAQALQARQRFTIAMLDLDRFKDFNDTYGHPAGDLLLKETAAIWREQLRGGDLLARLGGEEFGLLLLDCDTPRAVDVIERLRRLIPRARTCSAGFAEHRAGETVEAVMARADAALYDAKSAGRDRVCMST